MNEKINILNELMAAESVFLINTSNNNYFYVPDNYFNNLADNVITNIFIQSLPTVNFYAIPSGYFENLPEIVLEKVNLSALVVNEKELFSVPDGYFNNLATTILKKIKQSESESVQQELEEISPLLSRIPKTNVYIIPKNYFSELDPLTNANNTFKSTAKIISFGKTTRNWINYAVAACIATVMFTSAYIYFFNNTRNTTSALAKIDVQKEISVLSNDEIANYLKDNNNIAVYTNSGDDVQQQSMDIQNLLQNVSDQEIQQYLNQNPESTDGEGGI